MSFLKLVRCLLIFSLWIAPHVSWSQPSNPTDRIALKQLRLMGYLLLRCSNINLINGLQLTNDQAHRLFEISRLIDVLSPPPSQAVFQDDPFAPVIEQFKHAEKALRLGKPIPDSFRQTLLKTREQQAAMLLERLRFRPKAMVFSCQRCHALPNDTSSSWKWYDIIARHPGIKKEQLFSHMVMAVGLPAWIAILYHSNEIYHMLSESQKAALKNFTCCLLPPKDMANPVRVGQAETGDWEIPLLEKARAASRITLPLIKFGVKRALIGYLVSRNPGATKAEKESLRQSIDQTIDEARTLSDVDFALQKETLAKKLISGGLKPSAASDKMNAAYFLLIPGSSELYLNLLQQEENHSLPNP